MSGPLLKTKLHVPRRRQGLVARPRLIDILSHGAESALTLVSAPAGFGKTSLVADWLATTGADGRAAAWLSLDQRDNDPALFWTYLVAALKTAVPGTGESALSLLESPQPPMEAVAATLLNDLSAISNDVVMVLDDYHVLDARDVLDGMTFLLEHLPPQIHLVIASRADPALPLARLRGRGELVEIRVADLRFTPEETAMYLNGVMGLGLTAEDVTALEGRTEGWIAALQLAALSMRGRDDVAGFIAGFAGDDRYIVDYLVEEVLQRPSDTAAKPCSMLLIEETCSWFRSTTVASGTATTSSLLTFCRRTCWTNGPPTFQSYTVGRARGMSKTVSRPRRSAMRWLPRISSERRSWSSSLSPGRTSIGKR
jgi:LuxR family maltose regulon positive regulatory protein